MTQAPIWLGPAIGGLAVVVWMTALWVRQLRTRNAGIVDPGWVLCFVILSLCAYGFSSGWPVRKAAMLALACLWAVRLSVHLGKRYLREAHEDPRYQKMRREQGSNAPVFFLGVFLFQAATTVILSLPCWIWAADARQGFSILEMAGLTVWLGAWLGEALADRQLAQFKLNPASKGKVCENGLWRYSRHPNYFFECVLWIGWFLISVSSPGGAWALVSPLLMIYFIVFLSGIPPAEAQSLASRGDLYRQYQQKTSPLIPWFRAKT